MALDLSGFKPFEPSDYSFFFDRLHSYKRRYPRFYESFSRYLHQPHVFWWGMVDDHLCILKRRQIMGNPVCYLMLPPIGPNPRSVMEIFQWEKISTMLSEEDIEILGLSEHEVVVDKGNAEYCYRLDAFSDRYGVNKNQLRQPVNQALRMQESGQIDIRVLSTYIPPAVRESAVDLTMRWKQQRDKKAYKPTFFLHQFSQLAIKKPSNHVSVFIMEGERCLGYLITELTPNGIINNVACTDYEDNPLRNTTLVLLHTAATKWIENGISESTIVNRGAAVRGAGSKVAKEKLRPVCAHQNYKLKIDGKLSKAEYDALWSSPKDDLEWL